MMVLSQQRQEVRNLFDDIQLVLQIGSLPHDLDPSTIIEGGDWYVSKDSIHSLIIDQGSWARDMFHSLEEDDKDLVVEQVGWQVWFVSYCCRASYPGGA